MIKSTVINVVLWEGFPTFQDENLQDTVQGMVLLTHEAISIHNLISTMKDLSEELGQSTPSDGGAKTHLAKLGPPVRIIHLVNFCQ